MTKSEYRLDLATRTFGMLVLKKGQVSTTPGQPSPAQQRIDTALESFAYADAFMQVSRDQGVELVFADE